MDEYTALQNENHRLKRIISALMYEYNTICEVNFYTGKINFLEIGSPLFENLGIHNDFPHFDELAALYLKYGVYEEDRPLVQPVTTCKELSKLQFGKSITKNTEITTVFMGN